MHHKIMKRKVLTKRKKHHKFRKTTKKIHHKKGGKSTNTTRIYGRIHAKWCGHCLSMAEDWVKIINDKLFLKDAVLFDIEQSEEKEKIPQVNEHINKGGELKVGGYPTIFKVVNGKVEYFNGTRTYDNIRKWFNS